MYLRVLAFPTSGELLKVFCKATILMTYSVPGFRPTTKNNKHITHELAYTHQWSCTQITRATLTLDNGIALSCMWSGDKFLRQTPCFFIGDIVPSNTWTAWRFPGERDAVGVQGGEVDVGGWVDQRLSWKWQTKTLWGPESNWVSTCCIHGQVYNMKL